MFNKQTALIIETDTISAKAIARVLKDDLNFNQVILVSAGKEAETELKSRQIDWIFGAWEMPDMLGIDLLINLRKNANTMDVPFIMLSNRIDRNSLLEAISHGVSDFIAKPFTPATISEKVKRVVRIREKRIAPRITPTKKFSVEFQLHSSIKIEGEISNISTSGILISASRLKQAAFSIYDIGQLNIAIDNGLMVRTQSRLIRMEIDYAPTHTPETHILYAFDFREIDDENRLLLNNFINEQRRLTLST